MDNFKYKALLVEQFKSHSFQEVKDLQGNVVEGLFLRIENPVVYVACYYDEETSVTAARKLLFEYSAQLVTQLDAMGCTHLIPLGLFLGGTDFAAEESVVADSRVHPVEWLVDIQTGAVVAGKDAPTKLLGIEKWLQDVARGKEAAKPLQAKNPQGKPWVCMSIFAICAIFLGITTFLSQGDRLIYEFGLSRSGILQGEYYRFLSSMFLHSGAMHLLSNSIFLYYFGTHAERFLGWKKFLILYVFAGLWGGIFSVIFHDVLAIGASGAIYGLLGAMLMLTKRHGATFTGMNYSTMLLLALASMGFGFLDMGVDNFAHVGGFLGGIVVFLLFLRGQPREGMEQI